MWMLVFLDPSNFFLADTVTVRTSEVWTKSSDSLGVGCLVLGAVTLSEASFICHPSVECSVTGNLVSLLLQQHLNLLIADHFSLKVPAVAYLGQYPMSSFTQKPVYPHLEKETDRVSVTPVRKEMKSHSCTAEMLLSSFFFFLSVKHTHFPKLSPV